MFGSISFAQVTIAIALTDFSCVFEAAIYLDSASFGHFSPSKVT
jgi:hypothetical protein